MRQKYSFSDYAGMAILIIAAVFALDHFGIGQGDVSAGLNQDTMVRRVEQAIPTALPVLQQLPVLVATRQPVTASEAEPALDTPPTPTAEPLFSPQFLADCAYGISLNRRVHPRCPGNAAEMLGTGR